MSLPQYPSTSGLASGIECASKILALITSDNALHLYTMAGMFWHNNYAPSVQIDSLLSQENVTLDKLMDAEDILQECKSQNKKLIEYLTRADILEELVNLITEEPSEELDERSRYKYSNIACELLTSEVPILTETIANNEMLLAKLYSFIDKEEPLNPLLASFFSKTLHTLLRRASDQNWFSHQLVCLKVLESLMSRKNCVDLLLQHIQTSAIMDLILILLTKIEDDEMRQNILNWLDDQKLIQRLIQLLSPSADSEKHTNASQLLCDIVKTLRMEPEKRPDPILQTLQSEETIKLVLDTIFLEQKIESSIVGGVRILINLLGQKESKISESTETYGAPFNNIVEDKQRDKFALIIIPYLDKFNELLLNPPEKPSVKTTAGFLEKPFGRSRLYILILYVSMLSTENSQVLQKFAELDTFNILLDLFVHFAWNNFLHTQVQQCLCLVINSNCPEINENLYSHIFVKSKLIDRILDAWESNDNNIINKQNGLRQGYMGHLIIMANEVAKHCEENNDLTNYLKVNLPEETMQKWETFVSTKLDEINKKQQITLGEPPETYMMSATGIADEYASFPQDSYGQEMYSNFQEQSSAPMYSDGNCHFRIEKFIAGNDIFQDSMNLTVDDFKKSQDLFNEICEDKKLDDDETDLWEPNDDFQSDKSDWFNKKTQIVSSSSDEEDEEDPRDMCMESDGVDPWNTSNPPSTMLSASTNLWDSEAPEPVAETGWANFDNFNSAFSTDNAFKNNPCNEAKAELPEVPIILNENVSLSEVETGSNLNSGESKENVNKIDDTDLKTEKINVSSVSNSDCLEISVNKPDTDGNANLTVLDDRTSESKDVSEIKNSEDNPRSKSDASLENLTNVQSVTSATDSSTSSITTVVPESSQ